MLEFGSAPDPRLRCLVIEDDAVSRALAVAACGSEGIAVDAPDAPEDAVRLSAVNRYQVVILDHQLAGDLGLQLLEDLENQIYRAQFILITAERAKPVIDRYRRLGIQQVLHKPFSRSELAAAVRTAIAKLAPWE